MRSLLLKFFSLCILLGLSCSQVYAEDWIVSVGYAGIPSETINNQRYSSSANVNLWFGAPEAINFRQGVYINAALPEDVWSSRDRRERTSYTLLNAGMTFNPTETLTLYAGPGFSYQRVNQSAPQGTIHRYRLNANLGAVIKVGNFGVNFSYDTAPKAFGIGFVVQSSVFQ